MLLFAALAGLAAAAVGCDGFIGEWTFYTAFGRRFAKLKLGTTRADAVASLGPPQRENATLQLPEAQGYESEYERANASGAIVFLYWETGADEVAVVGLDTSSRVVFKCTAGS